VKALTALGIQPDVFHMNEGHSAFLALERIRLNVVEKKLDFYSALQVVARPMSSPRTRRFPPATIPSRGR
jgi:Glucan phosphorylase